MGTEKCEWHVAGCSESVDGCFYIDDLNNVHTYKGVLRQKKHDQLGSKVVKTCIQEDISYNMSMKPRDIQIKMQSVYGFEISYKYMSIALLARLFTKGPSFVQLEGLEIKDSLESQGRVVTFMSDHGNGLLGSFKKVLLGHPHHLFCQMHLSANLTNRHGGMSATVKNAVKNKFFELAYASSPVQYRLHLRRLREIGGAEIIDDFLKEMPLENWCSAFFPGSRYVNMTNSMVKSFNA
ncbi:hypothetical protein ACLB2K_001768 [Fragaria x ananassa]